VVYGTDINLFDMIDQTEPGGQAEQASPSGVLQLSPEEMAGFRYLTISVAPLLVCVSLTLNSLDFFSRLLFRVRQ
jgi:hypothetical protein